MEKQIFTALNTDDLKSLIIEAVKQANSQTPEKSRSEELNEDYMDQQEAAKFLKISLPTIIRWKREMKIPYFQEGRTVLFKKSELLNVLRKNEKLLR